MVIALTVENYQIYSKRVPTSKDLKIGRLFKEVFFAKSIIDIGYAGFLRQALEGSVYYKFYLF